MLDHRTRDEGAGVAKHLHKRGNLHGAKKHTVRVREVARNKTRARPNCHTTHTHLAVDVKHAGVGLRWWVTTVVIAVLILFLIFAVISSSTAPARAVRG